MININQKVELKWNPSNKSHFQNINIKLGYEKYIYTFMGDKITVDLKDIPNSSKVKIEVICDYCNKLIMKSYDNYNLQKSKNEIKSDCCKECTGMKLREKYGTLDELSFEESNIGNNDNGLIDVAFLKNEITRYISQYAVLPTTKDIKNNKQYPKISHYNRIWGTFSNFLLKEGFISDDGWYTLDEEKFKKLFLEGASAKEINESLVVKKSIDEMMKKIKYYNLPYRNLLVVRSYNNSNSELDILVEALKHLYDDIGRIPTVIDYESYLKINNLSSRRLLEKLYGKSYSKICIELFGNSNKITKTNEELLSELINLKNKLGRTPLAIELKANGLSEAKAYTRRFDMSYTKLIKSFGWELSSPESNYRDNDDLISDYHNLYKSLGRIPDVDDINNNKDMASYTTYKKYFGSLYNVLDILKINYSDKQNISSGFVDVNFNGELCKSSKELIISNILFLNNIKYTPEVKYSDFDKQLKNKWKMDWYLPDHEIYIEYFGMYSITQLNRNTIVGKYTRKANKKIKYCNDNNIKLISVFKKDLENNCSGLIEKLKLNNIKVKHVS